MSLRPAVLSALILVFTSSFSSLFSAEWFVDASVAQSGDGTTWTTALKTIQEGVNAASGSSDVRRLGSSACFLRPVACLLCAAFVARNPRAAIADVLKKSRRIIAPVFILGSFASFEVFRKFARRNSRLYAYSIVKLEQIFP